MMKETDAYYPFIIFGKARFLIKVLSYCVIILAVSIFLLMIILFKEKNKEPWILIQTDEGFKTGILERWKPKEKDIIRFLNYVIPALYTIYNKSNPGIPGLYGIVDKRILISQENEVKRVLENVKEEVTRTAIIQRIIPETLVIRYEQKLVYAEVLGTILLTVDKETKKIERQWRTLSYIIAPSEEIVSNTPIGMLPGSRFGLYLVKIEEQPPGTINPDIPKIKNE